MPKAPIVLTLVLAACNGASTDDAAAVWTPGCSADLTVGETTTDVCANHALEVLALEDDDSALDLRLILGSGSTDCLARVTVDDVCGAGRYWVDGGATIDLRLAECGGGEGAATSGSLLIDTFSLERVGGELQVTVRGTLSGRLDGVQFSADVDVSATSAIPSGADFAACSNTVEELSATRAELTPGVDVLFVVDDAISMADEVAALDAAFPALLAKIEAENPDYHIGVLSMDTRGGGAGRLRDGGGVTFLTPETPDKVAAFSEMIDPDLGSATATGRRAVERALTEPMLSGDNAGFYRPYASLQTVFLSNRNDASGDDPPLQEFTTWIAGLKRYGPISQVSSIVGQFGGCATAEQGGEFSTITVFTRGTFVSVCDGDYATVLDHLAPPVLRRGFLLPTPPVLASVRVLVEAGGDPVDLVRGDTWTWEDPWVVVDRDALPEGDLTVRVLYTPAR